MSIIRCKNNCTYQEEGYCSLDKANAMPNENQILDSCVYYVPKPSKNKNKDVSDN